MRSNRPPTPLSKPQDQHAGENCFIMQTVQTVACCIRLCPFGRFHRAKETATKEERRGRAKIKWVLCNIPPDPPPLCLMARGHLLGLLHATLTLPTSLPLFQPLISSVSHQGCRDWRPPSNITVTWRKTLCPGSNRSTGHRRAASP